MRIIIVGIFFCIISSFYGQKNHSDSLKSVIAKLNTFIQTHPNDFNSYLQRANFHYELSNDKFGYEFEEKALMDYNVAILLNPKSDTAFNKRGYLYQVSGKDTLAILDFTKAIELNPNYTEAYFNKGFSEYIRGNYTFAINYFTKAIELNSNYNDAYAFRGYSFFFIGNKYEAACEDWQKAHKLGYLTLKENIYKYCK